MADVKISDLGAAVALTDSYYSVIDNGTNTNKVSAPVMREYFVGDLTALDTLVKTSVVAAINEIVAALGINILYFTSVACSATTGDFATISNANITADHVVAQIYFANSAAITSEVTVTTSAGSAVINGTCASATTCDILLVKKSN
jgi:hypothetical protein